MEETNFQLIMYRLLSNSHFWICCHTHSGPPFPLQDTYPCQQDQGPPPQLTPNMAKFPCGQNERELWKPYLHANSKIQVFHNFSGKRSWKMLEVLGPGPNPNPRRRYQLLNSEYFLSHFSGVNSKGTDLT